MKKVFPELEACGVEIRGDERICSLWPHAIPAVEADWSTEYGDLILSVRVVDSLEEAINHISRYSTHHSECIVTENKKNARRFVNAIDAACVYVNASTRFTDGFEFGFGAEIGISTQKLHVLSLIHIFCSLKVNLEGFRFDVWLSHSCMIKLC